VTEAPFAVGPGFGLGWKAVHAALVPMWLGGLLMSCTEGGGGGGGGGGSEDELPDIDWEQLLNGAGDLGALDAGVAAAVVLGLAVVLALVLAVFALRCFIHGGFLKLHEETLRTGQGSSSALFDGGDRFLDMAVFKILKTVFLVSTFIVSAAPGGAVLAMGVLQEDTTLMVAGGMALALLCIPACLYVTMGLALGEHAVVFDQRSGRQAVDRSWDLARGRRIEILVYLLVAGLLQIFATIVGVVMLCVGVLVTVPLAYSTWSVGFSRGYLLLTRDETETDAWAIA